MRIDHGTIPETGTRTSTGGRPTAAHPRPGVVVPAVLALLMAGTCWAVASWFSAWLVPPYLILMALILSPSPGRPSGIPVEGGSGPATDAGPADPPGSTDRSSPEASPATAGASGGDPDRAAASGPARARRGKGGPRKARPSTVPLEATWIQVAPGKFVRAEASGPMAESGPHDFAGAPVETPAPSPPPSDTDEADAPDRAQVPGPEEAPPGADPGPGPRAAIDGPGLVDGPIEDDPPGFDPVEGPGGDPGPGSPIDPEADGEAGSPRFVEELSAADGIAPQADGPFDRSEAGRPDAVLEEVDDRAWSIPRGSRDARATTPGPTGADPEGWPESEEADETIATGEGADPTETAVDETVLDDADPVLAALDDLDTSHDAAPPDPTAPQGVPTGPTRRPWRLAPRVMARVGSDPRSTGEAPPRRPVRSKRPSRRPPDPRRLARRGLGRPRQISRTFPPRSPPGPVPDRESEIVLSLLM